MPISPRNSSEAVASLLQATKAVRIISQPSHSTLATAVQSELASRDYHIEVAELFSIYDVFPTLKSDNKNDVLVQGPYPERKTTPAGDEPAIILHSSGSTGLLKPIIETQKILLQWVNTGESTLGSHIGNMY